MDHSSKGLFDFIFRDSSNKIFIWGSLILIVIQLLIFKYCYPYASFINGDSYTYLYSAFNNFNIYYHPIGYPKFLRLVSVFSQSDTALIIFQYLSIQISGIAFIFTLFYFFNPSIITKIILICFIVLNPIFLYMGSMVSSDALFLTLSLIWFNLLVWAIFRPNYKNTIFLSLILFLAFTVRYNALYYPLINFIGLLLIEKKYKLIFFKGSVIGFLLIGKFISFNNDRYFQLTGNRQFSAFSGWQIANNAMNMYKFVDKNKREKLPIRFQELDNQVREYFDSTKNNINHPESKWIASTIYMWTKTTPLYSYMYLKYGNKEYKEFENWAKIAPLYRDYGIELIKRYPWEYFRFFLYPNLLRYFIPPVEYLQNYNSGADNVQPIAEFWFNYKSNKINSIFKDLSINILNFHPIIIGILNIFFIMIIFSNLRIFNPKNSQKKLAIIVFSLWLLNLTFSIVMSPIALRFQVFPSIILTSFIILYLERLYYESMVR